MKKEKLNVQRTIWSVGQGAFYTEELEYSDNSAKYYNTCSIVYDCGSLGSGNEGIARKDRNGKYKYEIPTRLKECIDEACLRNLNYIFISHLHWDHINGIKYLLDHLKCNGKDQPIIVLPNMKDSDEEDLNIYYYIAMLIDSGLGLAITSQSINVEDRQYLNELYSFYRDLYYGGGDYLSGDQIYVVDDAKVFLRDREQDGYKFSYEKIDNETPKGVIDKVLEKIEEELWLYIPITCKSEQLMQNTKTFIEEISKSFESEDEMKSFSNFCDSGLLSDLTAGQWEKIEQAVLRMKTQWRSKQNNLSMMLYSGTRLNANVYTDNISYRKLHCCCYDECMCCDKYGFTSRPSALYTGDMMIEEGWNKIVERLFARFKLSPGLGIYQISHHGHKNEFNMIALKHIYPLLSFCCYGSKNTYHHPNYRLMKLYWHENIVTYAMDENNDCLFQSIEVER